MKGKGNNNLGRFYLQQKGVDTHPPRTCGFMVRARFTLPPEVGSCLCRLLIVSGQQKKKCNERVWRAAAYAWVSPM